MSCSKRGNDQLRREKTDNLHRERKNWVDGLGIQPLGKILSPTVQVTEGSLEVRRTEAID